MLYRLIALLMLIALIVGGLNHRLDTIAACLLPTAIFIAKLIPGLMLMMALWLGLMRIAEGLGWLRQLTAWLRPVLYRLFPEIPRDDPALDYIGLNISANMLGMGNAATPFGVQAMRELKRLNQNPGVASDAMCLFLAINTSSVQLIPISAITILSVGGADKPWLIVIPALLATSVSTLVGVSAAKWFATWPFFNRKINRCQNVG